MSTSPVSVKFFSKQEFAQSNLRTVTQNSNGMRVRPTVIDTKTGKKTNNLISVAPYTTEKIVLISSNRDRFADLKHLNLILTNTCNLACSYCYEQHTKDYGRFTVESLKTAYDFLNSVNNLDNKLFQFFGGEPLIHKPLILDFLQKHNQELQKNAQTIRVSMITNGTLLTEDFIDEYFSNNFVNLSISLDTDIKDIDHREVTQGDIDSIFRFIKRIPEFHKNSKMVSVRCTISRETAPYLKDFATRLYNSGLRVMVIHPLTMSAGVAGNIFWEAGEWEQLHQTILSLINDLDGFDIQFSEGVGGKHNNNCMVGSDMIAVDASGDFAGCYFFTNQKDALRDTVLGNIFDNSLYINRYEKFQTTYDQMFEDEQCKACDLKGFCYQCPAGNMSTGQKQMFRPDSMCKQIVTLFIDLQSSNSKKVFKEKYDSIVTAGATMDHELLFRKMAVHLLYKKITGHHLREGEIDNDLDMFPAHEVILGHFFRLIINGTTTLPCACSYVPSITGPALSIRDLYTQMLDRSGVPTAVPKNDTATLTFERSAFYFALVHMVMLNTKGDTLQSSRKLVQL